MRCITLTVLTVISWLCCGCDNRNTESYEVWRERAYAEWHRKQWNSKNKNGSAPTETYQWDVLAEGAYDHVEFLAGPKETTTILHFQDGRTYALSGIWNMEHPKGTKLRVIQQCQIRTLFNGTTAKEVYPSTRKIVPAQMDAEAK